MNKRSIDLEGVRNYLNSCDEDDQVTLASRIDQVDKEIDEEESLRPRNLKQRVIDID